METSPAVPPKEELAPSDQAVLAYLQKKGLASAALDLRNLLTKQAESTPRQQLEQEDAVARTQRSLLSKSTGGGYGYDRDAAWYVVQWGVPERPIDGNETGVQEARNYVDSFVEFQVWVLSLGEGNNPLERARAIMEGPDASLEKVVGELIKDEPKKTLKSNSPKPELMAVTFALLVHTYCELLEVGMESTAQSLRDAFAPLYQPLYPNEFNELFQCTTTEDMMRLNSHNSQHMEALNSLKSILVEVASYQLRREELKAASSGQNDPQLAQKLTDYDRRIQLLQTKYQDSSKRASLSFDKMIQLPFLRRARAVRWQLTLSHVAYDLMVQFLQPHLAMSSLLQIKCEVHVEERPPVPFTPACVLKIGSVSYTKTVSPTLDLNDVEINWAAPSPNLEKVPMDAPLPFPKTKLDDEYDDEKKAQYDKEMVQFNRALLVNGFRRLEALERYQEYKQLAKKPKMEVANPLEPTILLSTLCSNKSPGPMVPQGPAAPATKIDIGSIWEESGIGLCCARICPPDGRRIAVGCDDAAIRIWDFETGVGGEPSIVLLGHKNGFPVFDVHWNRDGRTLLSAGGDGSIRLWDTVAVGPFGEVAKSNSAAKDKKEPSDAMETDEQDKEKEPSMEVTGLKEDSVNYHSGTPLAVYRGHAPGAPVWAVAFSPSGYYFASAGGDSTARLWATDRAAPLRLFSGHTAANVNCVEWHPNCNYIITGSDDKTARLWDIHSGRSVRLLTGGYAAVNEVAISPNGRYAAGADCSGVVHLWDLASGKRVTEFRVNQDLAKDAASPMVHRIAFSACGVAMATGGDDCFVRVWDVRPDSLVDKPKVSTPIKSFSTRRSLLMDFRYTKRNLLLSVGKFLTNVPLATPIPE